jgi:subtilisin family serine protease
VHAVEATGAGVRVTSRWLNGASVLATYDQVHEIAGFDFVEKIQLVRRAGQPMAPQATSAAESTGIGFYGLSQAQLTQINVTALHAAGYTGQGVIVGALDTGFVYTHNAFNFPGHPIHIHAAYDFLYGDSNVGIEPGDHPLQHEHGTQVLGTMAAYEPGTLVGSAFDASYILAKVEDYASEYLAEEDMFVAGVEFIEASGGDVATSSVVIYDTYAQDQLDGLTSVMTIGYNTATANGVHCCQGAGNQGHDANPTTSTLLPPSDGFKVITVGSVDSTGASAWFTSDGPTADGRVKPELMARGVLVRTVYPHNDTQYQEVSGASFATPTTAGAVACVVQAHPDWTVDQMRWALTHTADYYLANQTHDPLYIRGYGILDAFGAAGSAPPGPGDLDGDGVVGIVDLLALLAAWGPCPEPCPPWCAADLDADCAVGIVDFLTLLAYWG